MYQVAICDDEPHAAERNEILLCQILDARNFRRDIDYSVHCFASPAPLLAQLERHPAAFHLLLLDIELKNENGISLAAQVRTAPLSLSPLIGTMFSTALTPGRFTTCSNRLTGKSWQV